MNKWYLLFFVAVFSVGALFVYQSVNTQPVLVATEYIKRSPVSHVKPSAAVALSSSQVNLEVAGAQYTINVDIDSEYSNGDMQLDVQASEGLYILGGELNPTLSLTKGTIRRPFQVMAVQPGRYYIYVNVKVDDGASLASRALTFIVQVGEEEDSGDQYSQKATESGGVLVSMPAVEEIIR